MNPARKERTGLIGMTATLLIAAAMSLGCERQEPSPTSSAVASTALVIPLPAAADAMLRRWRTRPGDSNWIWREETGRRGPALLVAGSAQTSWRLEGLTARDTAAALRLDPLDPSRWHGFTVPVEPSSCGRWFPVPRIAVRSPYYADLLDLLLALTGPLHEGRVRRWSCEPIPVAPSAAWSGGLDLGGCLERAVDVWNDDQPQPLFVRNTAFATGVRLIHYPDRILHPPLWVRLLRRDEHDRPLLMHIVAGATYSDPSRERHATRALVHELAHVLQLWGHSKDPAHVLWRWGPVVDRPAPVERTVLLFWRDLPEGLDLRRYTRRGELELDP